jgi:hypothetical protein
LGVDARWQMVIYSRLCLSVWQMLPIQMTKKKKDIAVVKPFWQTEMRFKLHIFFLLLARVDRK